LITENNLDDYYAQLLSQAKKEHVLPQNAVKVILDQLESHDFIGDPYTLIQIIGECRLKTAFEVVASYVDYQSGDEDGDEMVRRIALQVIGRKITDIRAFGIAEGKVREDRSPYVKAVAATLLGFLGAKYPDLRSRAARLLLEGFERRGHLEAEVWESHYEGMLELLNVSPTEWPDPTTDWDESTIDDSLVLRIRAIAAEN
jgi:hypothetical protein